MQTRADAALSPRAIILNYFVHGKMLENNIILSIRRKLWAEKMKDLSTISGTEG